MYSLIKDFFRFVFTRQCNQSDQAACICISLTPFLRNTDIKSMADYFQSLYESRQPPKPTCGGIFDCVRKETGTNLVMLMCRRCGEELKVNRDDWETGIWDGKKCGKIKEV